MKTATKVAADESSRVRSRETCGDLLVTFGAAADTAPARFPESGPWEPADGLWLSPSGPGWRGFPLATRESGPWRFWLVGELIPPAGADVVRFLRGVAEGLEPASRLNGHFLLVAWSSADGRWHVWTDRFGTLHAYIGFGGPRPALGTCFASVAGVASRRRLDWPALAGFFACGFFPGDRTFFDDIRILRPSSHHVFSAEGDMLSAERYWRWSHRPDGSRSYDDTVSEFGDVLHRVLDEAAESGRMAVPISGGLDSRTTVAGLTRADRASAPEGLWSYSYGYGDASVETRIARRIAEARRLPFRAATIGPYLFDSLPAVLGCVEGFQDVTQSRQATVAEMLSRDADAVLAAHWGDVWLDDMGLEETSASPERVLDHALAKIAKRGGDWLLDRVVAPRLGAGGRPLLREMAAAELARVGELEDADFRVKAFKTEQWSFRWTLASLRMYQAGAFPRLPFYDTRMSDFFATVPTSFVRARRLQIDYLKRFAPDLARIPWQAYGTNLFRLPHFGTWLLPARAAKKVVRMLSAAVPQRNWEVQFGGKGGRRNLEEQLLSPGRKLHELVAPSDLRSLLDTFFAAPLEDGRGYTVSMLLTFSAWLEAHG